MDVISLDEFSVSDYIDDKIPLYLVKLNNEDKNLILSRSSQNKIIVGKFISGLDFINDLLVFKFNKKDLKISNAGFY